MTSLREKVKSFFLVILFASAVIMSQFILYQDSFAVEADVSAEKIQQKKPIAYISPQSYLISFGGMSYTRVSNNVLQERIWNEVRPIFVSAFLNHDYYEVISRDHYIDAFSKKSLLVRMPLSLPSKDLFSVLSEDTSGVVTGGIYPYEILLNEDQKNMIYIYDKKNEAYYRFVRHFDIHDVAGLVEAVRVTKYIEYRKMSDRFSLERTVDETHNQNNYELIPYEYDHIVPSYRAVKVFEDLSNREMLLKNKLTQTVFGNRMDFVKQLKDVNGAFILMYGYGEKILTFSPDGAIDYQEKYVPTSGRPITFEQALTIATNTLESIGDLPEGIYLEGYEVSDEQDVTHVFRFNYKVNRYAVANPEKLISPIVIQIRGSQVIGLYVNLRYDVGEPVFPDVHRLVSIDECINDNFLEVNYYYLQDQNIYDAAGDGMAYYFPIRSAIEKIEMRYHLVQREGDEWFVPVWHVEIVGRTYLFDAYTGDMLKTYR